MLLAPAPTPEEVPECFVCTDATPAPRKSACLCKDRYVHDACLAQMLKTAAHATCPVCAASYANVACVSRVVGIKCESAGGCACLLVLFAIVLLGCAANTWAVACCSKRNLAQADIIVVNGAATMMTVVGLGTVVFAARLVCKHGPTALAQSMIVRQLNARVVKATGKGMPAEVVLGVL